jgi:hypothetical protein
MSGFVFDAKAARAAIAARRIGGAGAAVRAVLAVDGRAMVQQPQQPQGDRFSGDAPTLARQPQEPQEPQRAAIASDEIEVAIEERAALAADRMPGCYLDAWARLQCQRPLLLAEGDWRRAIDDGGRFLDAWSDEAAALQWTPGELFDVTAGLVWRLAGERVETLGADHARLADGRILERN